MPSGSILYVLLVLCCAVLCHIVAHMLSFPSMSRPFSLLMNLANRRRRNNQVQFSVDSVRLIGWRWYLRDRKPIMATKVMNEGTVRNGQHISLFLPLPLFFSTRGSG